MYPPVGPHPADNPDLLFLLVSAAMQPALTYELAPSRLPVLSDTSSTPSKIVKSIPILFMMDLVYILD